MADPNPSRAGKLTVCILTLDAEIGRSFLNTVCDDPATGDTVMGGIPAHLEMRPFDEARSDEMGAVLSLADAAALLVHHVDAPAIDLLKGAFRILPSDHKMPVILLMAREPSRTEFKMACPNCSQKLWVRDEDQDRVGRCPHCKKTFVLPSQVGLIKQLLALPDSVPSQTITVGNQESCRAPLAGLVERARLRSQVMKNTTVAVQIAHEHLHPPNT